jgi:hypothetical protein
VQAGDTIKLKQGTVHDSTDGGKILIDSTYYVTTAITTNGPITIQRDITWGSGSVEFNGTGMTLGGGGFGLIHIKVGGVVIDGVSGTNGIIVAKSPYDGISAFPSADIQGPSIYSVMFGTNGTTYVPGTDDASAANLQLLRSHDGIVANCSIMAGGSSFEGISFGENHLSCYGYVVTNVTVADLNGNDDGGIAFKPLNSQVSFYNCSATRCFKGWDVGEVNGDGSNILCRIFNSTSFSNIYGINFNAAGAAYAGTVNFYAINNLIYTNGSTGMYVYAGPYNVYVIHNTFYNNGAGNAFQDANLRIENDGAEIQDNKAYVYNNIFYKPFGPQNFYNHYFRKDVQGDTLNLNMDNNAWFQRASELFASWAGAEPTSDNTTYSYVTDGPGHLSGNWYNFYSGDNIAPLNGRIGHYHADGYSYATGGDNMTEPPFFNVVSNIVTLTNHYVGTNISTRSWFTSEMGVDRLGVSRVAWDLGAFEPVIGPAIQAKIGPGRPVMSQRQ